jgi:hypothetical protein
MPVIAGSRDDTEQNPVKDQQPAANSRSGPSVIRTIR